MIYDYLGNALTIYPSIVGDGVTDDTEALQALVDNYAEVWLSADLNIKITDTIEVDTSKCHFIGGRNCTILPDGDITAFHVFGSMDSSMHANPNTLTAQIMNDEGGFTICGLRIQGEEEGIGIELDACFKANVRGCYLHHLNTGILISNQCRDFIISENHIFANQQYGIEIGTTANIHQCNIENNIINYALYCILFNKPRYVANFQITGNDIEINGYSGGSGGYPSGSPRDFRCIKIDARTDGETDTDPLAEIEIVGNTIQGHGGCDAVIEMVGDQSPSRTIKDINITGNHISMSYGELIDVECVNGAIIEGNTFRVAGTYAVLIGDNCSMVSVVDNNCADSDGFIKNTGTVARLRITNNTVQTTDSNPFDVRGTLTNAMINGNVLSGSNTSMTVNPTTATRVMVANNICSSGSYTLHSDVTASNNV